MFGYETPGQEILGIEATNGSRFIVEACNHTDFSTETLLREVGSDRVIEVVHFHNTVTHAYKHIIEYMDAIYFGLPERQINNAVINLAYIYDKTMSIRMMKHIMGRPPLANRFLAIANLTPNESRFWTGISVVEALSNIPERLRSGAIDRVEMEKRWYVTSKYEFIDRTSGGNYPNLLDNGLIGRHVVDWFNEITPEYIMAHGKS